MASVFRGTLDFMNQLGVYDVVLPYLLIFTIVFAILEKTKVFGVEEISGVKYTKKNLNAMVAFVIAFFVVASSKLVEIITKVSSNIVIVLIGVVLFLMVYGTFQEETEKGVFLSKGWNRVFAIMVFTIMIVIFLDAIKTGEESWLQTILNWVSQFWDNTAVASVILIIVIVGMMFYVINAGPKKDEKK